MNRLLGCALVLAIALVGVSCTELPASMPAAEEGILATERRLPDARSIPAEWGDLVSVTHSDRWEHAFQLWFENDEGTIRMAVYDSRDIGLQPVVVKVGREPGGAE